MKIYAAFFSLFFLSALPVFAQSEISDADGDTKVQTEKNANEDIIRMDLKGRECFVIRRNSSDNTLIELPTTDLNLFIGLGPGSNNSGRSNTFLGQECGVLNTIGQENTFVGHAAGHGNTTGTFNTFLGEAAGMFNSSGSHNTFLGESAGYSNTTASDNTYIGASSGVSGTTAQFNAFLGAFTGLFNTASGNTFVGHCAGKENTTGSGNTFLGRDAGQNNTTAGSNTFLGASAGAVNTTGISNTFVGQRAGTANTLGTRNTFLGDRTGQANTTGGSNTFIGEIAGIANTTGTGNTYLGKNAGDSQATNTNCTFLGNGADALLNGLTNSTALGNGAIVNTSNKIRLGNTAVMAIEGQVVYTTSDGRFKSEVKTNAPGLEFVMGLRPVTYQFDYTKFSDFLGEENVDYDFLHQKEQNREMGFIAQEVEQLCAKQGLDISNIVHIPEGEADNYSVAYGQLVVPLVKAVQEQQAEIEALKTLVNQLLSERQSKAAAKPAVDNIQIWPNPADEAVYVSLPETGTDATISLISSNGVLMQSISTGEAVQKMDMRAFPAGTYYVQILNPGQAPVVKTIVKGQ